MNFTRRLLLISLAAVCIPGRVTAGVLLFPDPDIYVMFDGTYNYDLGLSMGDFSTSNGAALLYTYAPGRTVVISDVTDNGISGSFEMTAHYDNATQVFAGHFSVRGTVLLPPPAGVVGSFGNDELLAGDVLMTNFNSAGQVVLEVSNTTGLLSSAFLSRLYMLMYLGMDLDPPSGTGFPGAFISSFTTSPGEGIADIGIATPEPSSVVLGFSGVALLLFRIKFSARSSGSSSQRL